MTVRDLLTDSLVLIGVIAPGETPSAADIQTAQSTLNMMIKSWNTERLSLFKLIREVFSLVPSQGSYTIGTGLNFNTTRPMEIVGAAIGDISGGNVAQEMCVEILEYQLWMGISAKTMTSELPSKLYFEEGVPNKVHLYPVPSVVKGLVLYSKKALEIFDDLDEEIDLPDGYEEALLYNCALRLGSRFGRPLDGDSRAIATSSKANIKRQNTKVGLMKSDAFGAGVADRRSYDIYRGS